MFSSFLVSFFLFFYLRIFSSFYLPPPPGPIFPLLHICRETIRQSLCWGSANSTQSLLQTTVSPPSSVGRKVVLNNSLHTPTHSYYANPFISSTVFVLYHRVVSTVVSQNISLLRLIFSLFGCLMYMCRPSASHDGCWLMDFRVV